MPLYVLYGEKRRQQSKKITNMVNSNLRKFITAMVLLLFASEVVAQQQWQSQFVSLQKDGRLTYHPDEQGNIIPDFSRVGYHQGFKAIPQVKTVITLQSNGVNDQELIQKAIDQLAQKQADEQGIRGAILLKKGTYKIPGTLQINVSGIVLRGEGEDTKLIATGKGQRKTIVASGSGNLKEISGTRVKITDSYVPVGAKQFKVAVGSEFKAGDQIVVFRPGNAQWIADLKMDQIEPGNGTVQWTAADYNLDFERKIVAVKGNTITIDNPIVMAMEVTYGGGEIYKSSFEGRIAEVGIENMSFESEYESDTDEDHGWDAISFNKIENSWITNVTSKFYGYSCVNLSNTSKQITVNQSKCLSPKSQIIGGRRYSFNNDGQLNLVMNCFASEGRHDYVTGAKVRGPNVFYNCKSVNAKADIGPHHRWATGTLYDNVVTDGEINIQDRGNWGTGHGWSGVNQVLWNCTAAKAAVQNPYASGKNYAIGLTAEKVEGRLKNRPTGVWEGQNKKGLNPQSLYLRQLIETKNTSL
jgi:hypothetical protein